MENIAVAGWPCNSLHIKGFAYYQGVLSGLLTVYKKRIDVINLYVTNRVLAREFWVPAGDLPVCFECEQTQLKETWTYSTVGALQKFCLQY